jgi:hypothetical protein
MKKLSQKELDAIWDAADKYVFTKNGHKWSNNTNEAGDNFGSFIHGAMWAMRQDKKEFNRGFAVAVAMIVRLHDELVLAKDVYKENFMTLAQLKKCGVEDYDIESLKLVIKEIKNK